MTKLKVFADQGTPLFADLNQAAPGLSKATVNLPKFAREGVPALRSLGDAAQTAGPKLAASDGLLADLSATASSAVPIGQDFSAFLDTFTKTQGFKSLMDFIFNSVGSTNGIDAFGHFLRSNLQLTSCVEIAATVQSGCGATFGPGTTTVAKKKKKKGRKAVRKARAKLGASSPLPQVDVPNLQDLLPQLAPEQGTPEAPEEGTPDDGTDQKQDQPNDVSMKQASLFLQFLLGGGA